MVLGVATVFVVTACGSQAPAATAPSSPAAGAAATTPAAVTAAWVSAVLENRYDAACELMVDEGTEPPKRVSPETCAQAGSTLDGLREAWRKDVVTLPAQVTVAEVTPQGATALVPDTDVLVNGHSLRDLQSIGATGAESVRLSLALRQLDATWYVSDVKMSFG
ncbi:MULTISPECIES: hypothetical protein [Amycolatopsis]|uniref:Lipoprotein n=1 Tax=Amycolatopsis thermalba TaxID=944492 RepID=A0ABY4NV84_9PSEU|nr:MULTISPECIES: hypothetical protein [Amycolatopsis]OXM72697.1 hypothetical protein CF166_13860 [Amycolatopsis sp. KNN50.9b]UQS23921.1 hypothetical protein L1857_14310 [Amycolatopsis thermalba]